MNFNISFILINNDFFFIFNYYILNNFDILIIEKKNLIIENLLYNLKFDIIKIAIFNNFLIIYLK